MRFTSQPSGELPDGRGCGVGVGVATGVWVGGSVGCGVSRAGECLTDIVGNYYRSIAFSACANTPIVLARLGNDAGIYGAAKLVLGKL